MDVNTTCTLFASTMASILPSKLLLFLISPSSSTTSHYFPYSLRHYLLLLIHALLFLFRLLFSFSSITLRTPRATTTFDFKAKAPDSYKISNEDDENEKTSSVARALSDVLSSMSKIPVWSRKYELVRDLAARLISDNVRYGSDCLDKVNRVALAAAFGSTIRRAEMARNSAGDSYWSMWSRLRRWKEEVVAVDKREIGVVGLGDDVVEMEVEKMAAELLWLAEKMVACGAVKEAVGLWGSASELARISLASEPKLQSALVKVSAFLFKHLKQMIEEGEDQDQELDATRNVMSMLISWLPLLCRATNGTDSPVLGSKERAETVKVLEQIIEKLNREHQEEVLTLWLHHFTANPHSHWPNLQSCYIQWYSRSRRVLLDCSMDIDGQLGTSSPSITQILLHT